MPTQMFRQTLSFSRPQEAWLKSEADRLEISVAEVVRRVIDRHREEREALQMPKAA